MRKISQCVQSGNETVDAYQTIDAINEAGFDGVFIQWYDKDWTPSQQERLDYCRKQGLEIVFAHLGYSHINDIWLEGEVGERVTEEYIKNLDECKENGIDLVVMHLSSKKEPPQPNELGVKRFQRIVDYAEKLGIRIAIENTRKRGYLEYVFDRITNKNLGFCFASGHYHCHFKDELDWERFRGRIWAVHLHDNDGSDDQHLLPFDGTLNWEKTMDKLKEYGYTGPVTLESCYRYDYLKEDVKKFYKESFSRGKVIREMLDN